MNDLAIQGGDKMKTSGELKAEAKGILAGRWAQAVMLNLIPTLIQIAIMLITIIPLIIIATQFDPGALSDQIQDTTSSGAASSGRSFIGSIIGALFASGIGWTYLDLLRGKKQRIEPLADALRAFSGKFFVGILLVTIMTSIFLTLWALLLVIPMFIKYYSYSQVNYIYYDIVESSGEKPKILDTITFSRKLMQGHKMDLFVLDLSFIGWHLLAMATLGIGYLWLNPYIAATKAAFYNALPNEVSLEN